MRALLSLLLLVSLSASAQRKHYFPIWTFQQDSIVVNGLSVGLASLEGPFKTTSNGIKLEIGLGFFVPLIPKTPIADSPDVYNKLISDPNSEHINGLYLSGTGAVCECKTNGAVLGFVGHITRQVNGLSACLFFNFAQKHNGVQLAIFSSDAFVSSGLQVSIFNEAHILKGVQLGVINHTIESKGLQIGVWNVNEKRKLPIINW